MFSCGTLCLCATLVFRGCPQDRLSELSGENDELRSKLELQTQRLELQLQGSLLSAQSVPLMSLHQVRLWTPEACEPSTQLLASASAGAEM